MINFFLTFKILYYLLDTNFIPFIMITNRPDSYYYESLERENSLINEFIREFPLPSYEECIKIIRNLITDDLRFDIESEFGEINYRIIKGILKHFNDKKYIKISSKLIIDRGGEKSLIMNLYFINRYVYHFIKNSGLTFSHQEQVILLCLNKLLEGIIFT